MAKDYYQILGVRRNASDKEIKQAYRRLARKYHPDVNPGSKEAEARFKEIGTAFEVLSDPETRRKYDQYGENWQQAEQFTHAWSAGQGPRANPFDFGGARTRPGSGFGGFGLDLDDLLGGIFGDGGVGRGGGRARKGQDVEHPTQITLEEAYHGTTRVLQLQGEEPCPVCKGAGSTRGVPCAACRGAGFQVRPRRLDVKIPPGVKDGSRVRIAGEGGPGSGGGPRGDLFLVISVRPHGRFQRKDDDLYAEVEVPLTIAVLGGEVRLPTLRGTAVALKIPPETQNGRVIRLGGLGMPRAGNPAAHGDLYARVRVILPTKLTAEQRRLFEALQGTM